MSREKSGNKKKKEKIIPGKNEHGKLTMKQEEYVRHLVAGDSQRTAFRKAYPNSRNWKDNSVDSQASTTLKIPKVYERYLELRHEVEEEEKEALKWTREEAKKELFWIINQSKNDIIQDKLRQANSQSLINAIKEMNRLTAVAKESEYRLKQSEYRLKESEYKLKENELKLEKMRYENELLRLRLEGDDDESIERLKEVLNEIKFGF